MWRPRHRTSSHVRRHWALFGSRQHPVDELRESAAETGLLKRIACAVRRFNRHAADDDRVDTVMLPISDGLTLLRKR